MKSIHIAIFGPPGKFSTPIDSIALLRDHGKASIPIHRGYTPIYFPFEDIEYLSSFKHSSEHSTTVLIPARVTYIKMKSRTEIVRERISYVAPLILN